MSPTPLYEKLKKVDVTMPQALSLCLNRDSLWSSHLHNTHGKEEVDMALLGWERGWGGNVAIAIYTPSTNRGQVNVINLLSWDSRGGM